MRKSKTFRPDRIGSYFRMEWLLLALVTASGLIYNVGLLATPWFEGRLAQCLADILGGNETAAQMAQAFQNYTGRGFYSMSSNEDYPTAAELIDYAYGRYNIHAYTIEVYSPGKSENGDISSCKWENTMPEAKWVFYSRDEIRDVLGLDPDAITDKDGIGLAADEGLWFYTSATNQMVNRTPEEQDVMVRGCRDAILTMIESEPSGNGYQNPGYYK